MSRRGRFGRPAWLALCALTVGVAARLCFGPESASTGFSSDDGIPVLMGNDWPWTPFHLFFFGQDRLGAWPYLASHLLAWVGRTYVTPQLLSAMAVVWLVSAVIPAALLGREGRLLSGLAFLAALLEPASRNVLYAIGQPYPWQVPALVWGWWALRRAQAKGTGASLLATVFCVLATWSSSLSGPMLLVIAAWELFPERRWQRWVRALAPPLMGVLVERLLVRQFHRFSRDNYHRQFSTALSLDRGHLLQNLAAQGHQLWASHLLLFVLVALVGGLLLRSSPGGREEARTVRGGLLLAALPLPALVALSHVRLNDYSGRYYAPSDVLAVWMAGYVLLRLAEEALARWFPRAAEASAAALGTGLLLWVLPRPTPDAAFERNSRTASALSRLAPGAFLIDNYGGTYQLAALAPPRALLPLPMDGQWDRIPWLRRGLPHARAVLVGHRELLADGSSPPWLVEYGVLLRREKAELYADGAERFSLYRPDTPPSQALGVTRLPQDPRHFRLTLTLPPEENAGTVVLELACHQLHETPGVSAQDGGGNPLAVQVRLQPGLVSVHTAPGKQRRVEIVVLDQAGCAPAMATWLDADDLV